MSNRRQRKYIGAYRDSSGNVRPITARTGSSGRTGVPMRAKSTSIKVGPKTPALIIADQLDDVKPLWRDRYSVKQLVLVDDNTLRLEVREQYRLPIKVEIRYDHGSDTYSIKTYEIKKNMAVYEVYEGHGFYTDNLDTVLDSIILDRRYNKNELIVEGL